MLSFITNSVKKIITRIATGDLTVSLLWDETDREPQAFFLHMHTQSCFGEALHCEFDLLLTDRCSYPDIHMWIKEILLLEYYFVVRWIVGLC